MNKVYVSARFIPENYQICTKSVMDNIADPNIRFDEQGISNYYSDYFKNIPKEVTDASYRKSKLAEIVNTINDYNKSGEYNCIIGVSGGVDSTYLALKAKEFGFRPLVVHFDNGWNSELAVKNIENIVNKLGFDLHTHVFDWEQYKDLQLAHFKANVVDIESITDVAINGVLLLMAQKYNIRYIISGFNYITESILPSHWVFKDYYNIIDIHKHFGTKKITLFPYYDNLAVRMKVSALHVNSFNLLNYLDYNKEEAKEAIKKELDWIDYGGKHYESIFTRFYQGYILPNKFGIDKRRAHFTNLICSGQITREEALLQLEQPIYNPEQLGSDYEFVIKKLGFSPAEFETYIQAPRVEHEVFDTEQRHLDSNWKLKSYNNVKGFLKKISKR